MAETITFDPSGGPLSAEVRCGYAQVGAYYLKLWESNTLVLNEEGTFFNPDDDRYELPGEASEQAGRLLQCTATIELLPPEKRYQLTLALIQDGSEIGSAVAEGETDQHQVTESLFVELEGSDG